MKYFFDCFRKYCSFRTRARRREFWFFCLFAAIILIIAYFLDMLLATEIYTEGSKIGGYIFFFASLVMLCPFAAVMTRRLHDTGKKKIWTVLFFILSALFVPVLLESWEIYGTEGGAFILALALLSTFVLTFYWIWLILSLCEDSKKEDNKYGKSPKYIMPKPEENSPEENTEEKTEDTPKEETPEEETL
ncbi:MAG: DUF805 domain-containing protein [Armatimonadetes bacterium]|nr:DUF805 domain-containing protein [Candidatus Hippobium faecium]